MEQITFDDYSKVMELENKYEIPRKYQKEERWTDDWHYTEIETPKESKIYYVICNTPQGHYNYTYMAWAYKHWWWFDSYQKKWHRCSTVRFENHIPFAWVEIPDLYLRTDDCLEERFETFIEPKLNAYYEDQDRRRMERKEGRWGTWTDK